MTRHVPPPSEAIERPMPLRQAVYEAISDMIISRTLRPGEHLVEQDLAARLGVSRQPIREALQRLQREGWVHARPGMGARVHIPDPEEVDQLLAVRALLEGESALLAAAQATPEDLEHLWMLQGVGEAALASDDDEQLVTANADLHAWIVHLSRNGVLVDHFGMLDRRMRWYYSPIARVRGQDAWQEHGAVIRAIAEGNGQKAGVLMREHAERTRAAYAAQGLHTVC
jgi:DNA-binding GntR family transcriptional regulator